jgi:hypothetical protein
MADLLNCLVMLPFGLADAAAAPSTPVFLVPVGVPDASDVDGFIMPKAGAIVGVNLMGRPTQSGDNASVQVYKNGTAVAGTVVANAFATGPLESGATVILSKDTAALQFKAGDVIQVKYTTVTGGTYGVNDLACQVLVQMGLSE